MDPSNMKRAKFNEVTADALPFARSYQVEALEKAIKQNTIVFLETGSGKTMIAIMLLRSYAHLFRKPSPNFAVFLVPQVVLVTQQADAVKMHTDLKVGKYWGDMGVDYWDAAIWKQQIKEHEVLVMTPAILLNCLRHAFFKLSMIKVLIIDECHHARGNHPYASIMREYYHSHLKSGIYDLPRILGMTASPIKTKGAKSSGDYWQKISDLETLMNSKVYTCSSESVLTEFIPFSTPKFRSYQQVDVPYALHRCLVDRLNVLTAKHEQSLGKLGFDNSRMDSIEKKISKINSTLSYCLTELGAWLAMKAAQFLSFNASDILSWGKMDISGDEFVRKFCQEVSKAFAAYIPSGPDWTIGDDVEAHVDAGFLTTKIACLIESLLEYSALKDIRCIIFVERVITAIVLDSLLSGGLSRHTNWKTKYIAGNNSGLQCQSRKIQNEIIEEFREGKVNIIVATSILEEGLDVQNCNLVIRFDPSATVCSFIQSRGRARMQNSDYILMVESGDSSTLARLENYLSSGDIIRRESLSHASIPCVPLDFFPEEFYRVASTGAIITRSSSVSLIYFYCSRLPSDGYFKPAPRCDKCEEKGICTLYLPKSCPIQTVHVQGNMKTLKQTACLEAVKQLHEVGALTDNLVPDIVVEEEAAAEALGKEIHNDEQPIYFPPELVSPCLEHSKMIYHCYKIELNQNFNADILTQDIVLGIRTELSPEIGSTSFELDVDGSILSVALKYLGIINLSREQILLCKKFQITIFKVLMNYTMDKIIEVLHGLQSRNKLEIDYLILPSNGLHQEPLINWNLIRSVFSSSHHYCLNPCVKGGARLHTKSGLACSCTIQNSLVYTPHNSHFYCITDILDDLNANSLMNHRDGNVISYKHYFERRHGIQLSFLQEPLLKARHMFNLQNYLIGSGKQKEKCLEPSRNYVELPSEFCCIIMSPISVRTVYSFTFIPSIMHRLESLLVAVSLKKIHSDHRMQKVDIPTMKFLEAITTKECQEKFHLESLETLGDSFLKYAVSQQLFKTYQNNHEGLLSVKKGRIISNAALCKLGCDRKLPGFIRTEVFNPRKWVVPGENSESYAFTEEYFSKTVKMYQKGNRKVKIKRIADVVEALIGAFLSSGGESAALLFMNWVGIEVDFVNVPYERNFLACVDRYINVHHLESLLNYSFKDHSLLMEALTHGSYMLPEISQCYQRLEFLGDAVLDYLVSVHLYKKYPGLSPGLLTDMRSASTNNDCYAICSVKAGLHKHICHLSNNLHKQIATLVHNFENISSNSETTFGWESEKYFPKVLGDVIESLAGAILVDSGYNLDAVFESIRPLLEPMITPETIKLHPVRELLELCQKQHFQMKKLVHSRNNNMASVTVHVEAYGEQFIHTSKAGDKWMAKKLASKQVLKALKERITKSD